MAARSRLPVCLGLALLLSAALGAGCGDAPAPDAPESGATPDDGVGTAPAPAAPRGANRAADDTARAPADAPRAAPVAPAADANLLLVTVDTLRADRLGCHGHAAARTPVLDALAARGARAERALAATPVTLPSHTTLLTGRHPFEHGVRDNGIFRVDAEQLTLAERLATHGRHAAAFVSAHVLGAPFGLDQGFAHYDDRFAARPGGSPLQRPADETVDRLLAHLGALPSDRARPWFAWLHLFDPHAPYTPPAEFVPGPFASAEQRYDGEVAFVDAQLGRVFAALEARGELARTLVVVTADHGESLGEHHELTHGLFVYESTQHVPLILAGPGVAPGRVLAGPLPAVDLAPTLLDLLGLPADATLPGRSFAARLAPDGSGAPSDPPRSAYLESWSAHHSLGAAPLAALTDAAHKYVEAPRPELYDLRADPDETVNLFTPEHPAARELARALQRLRGDAPAAPRAPAALDPEERERLQALGYLFAQPDAAPTGVDPKDVAQRSNELRGRMAFLLSRGAWVEALPVIEELHALLPGDVLARAALGKTLLRLGELERAEQVLRALLVERPDQPDAAIDLAHVLRLADRREEALGAYELALAVAPRHPTALLEAAQIAFELDRVADAVAYGERALASGALSPAEQARAQATVDALRARLR